MVRVLLINPHKDRRVNKENTRPPLPLTLICLATAIEDKHDVKIYDRDLNLNDSDFIAFFKKYDPDIVGFTLMTSEMILDFMYLGKLIKKDFPEKIIIVGGVHPTIEPDSVLNEPYVDYIIRSEGEEAFLEFCNVFEKDKSKLKKLNNVNHNPLRPFVNMDNLKLPNYSLVDLKKYYTIYVNFSRGCPGNCTFCYSARMWGKDNRPFIRTYGKEKSLQLFKEVAEKYNIRIFSLVDDNFITFKSRAIEICNFIKDYDLHFFCFGRADHINDEILKALKKAGCHTIQIGFESGNQRILNSLNKNITVKQNYDAIECCRRNGIVCDASFMIGLPTETFKEMRDTISFIKKTRPDIVNLKIYVPLPGAPLFDYCVQSGLINKPRNLADWALWTGGMAQVEHNVSEISDQELIKSAKEVWDINYYKTRFKRLVYWSKSGDIKHILKSSWKIFKTGQGNIKIPFMKSIRLQKLNTSN